PKAWRRSPPAKAEGTRNRAVMTAALPRPAAATRQPFQVTFLSRRRARQLEEVAQPRRSGTGDRRRRLVGDEVDFVAGTVAFSAAFEGGDERPHAVGVE